MDLRPKYAISEVYDEGAGVALYRAERLADRRRVLVKASRDHGEGLRREFEICAGAELSACLRALALDEHDARTLLVLEDAGHEPLARFLGDRARHSLSTFLSVAIALARAVEALHARGFVHRSLRPQHILIHPRTLEIKLTGFEYASQLRREPSPEALGSFEYISPEQTGRSGHAVDHRTDLYSLGVTLFELRAGAPPFDGEDALSIVHAHLARTPPHLAEVVPGTPEIVSRIVDKLLAKAPEERYQSAIGLRCDLEACARALSADTQAIAPFTLATHDVVERFQVPNKLYGREEEFGALVGAWERMHSTGQPELVLISGPSGSGKSALVRELRRGALYAGKCDELRYGIPHLPLARAFRDCLLDLMAAPEERVQAWRTQLQAALEPNAQLIIDVVPELERLLGKQPKPSGLPSSEAERRFHDTFRAFVQTLATAERPLSFFFDDLQWVDTASLAVLSHLFENPELRHVLVIGAYRTNDAATESLDAYASKLRERGVPLSQVNLSALSEACLSDLTSEALRRERADVAPLARLIHDKTAGNPFFVVQFLSSLYEDGLLRFEHGLRGFAFDLEAIRARGFTDNVLELLLERLQKLPSATRHALEVASCIGSAFQLSTLRAILQQPEARVAEALHEGVRAGVLVQDDVQAFRFAHDRIQHSAHSLIPDGQADELHLRLGRSLLESAGEAQLQEQIFAIVSHFNRAADRLTSAEKQRVAELNLLASQRARAAAANAAGLEYAAAGRQLLQPESWQTAYKLTLDLHLEHAHSAYLNKDFERAEALLGTVLTHARERVDRGAAYEVLVPLHTLQGEAAKACELARAFAREFGVELPERPSQSEVDQGYQRVCARLDAQPIESLAEQPAMRDPAYVSLLRVLTLVSPAALFVDTRLWTLIACERALLTIDRGATSASAYAYSALGLVIACVFDDVERARRLGKLALSLVDAPEKFYFRAPVYLDAGVLLGFWSEPLERVIESIARTQQVGVESGAVTFACYAAANMPVACLARGDTLAEVARETARQCEFLERHRFSRVVDSVRVVQLFVDDMSGAADASLRDAEPQLTARAWPLNIFLYYGRRLQLEFMCGRYAEALAFARRADALRHTVPGFLAVADFVTFYALAAAQCGELELCRAQLQQLQSWAESCPSTFLDRAQLVAAELARLEGRMLDAMRGYDAALERAHQHGFVHQEALAAELAARFYAAQNVGGVARQLLQRAHAAYRRWGAFAKLTAMQRAHPELAHDKKLEHAARMALPQIDLNSLMKASHTISSELREEELTRTLIRVVLEQAGAQRGCLILERERGLEVAASAESDAHGVRVDLVSNLPLRASGLVPETIVQYVKRVGEPVILADAAIDAERFAGDPYIAQRQVRSVLCLPVLRGVRSVGYLYLENAWVRGAFTRARLVVAESLATQAAIALENARLYSELHESEARLTKYFEGLPVGVCIVDAQGQLVLRNRKAIEIAGDRFDPAQIYLAGTDQLYAEERTPFGEALRGKSSMTDDGELHRDGRRVPLAIWGTPIHGDDGVVRYAVIAFQDISAQRMAEAERARLLEHLQLAERLDSIGRLAGGVAHDLNNLLVPMLAYSDLALKALSTRDPLREQISEIYDAAKRASDLVRQLLAFGRRQILSPKEFELGAELRALEPMLRRLVGLNITLALHTDPEPSVVLVDLSQLERILVNLAINAIDAMPSAGRLTISVRNVDLEEPLAELRPGAYALIEVSDTGTGMDAQTLARIFEPFFTTKRHGTGLGLPTVYGLTKQHSGHVTVRSELGTGTTFEVYLPLVESPSGARVRRSSIPAGPQVPKDELATVLVVDDDPMVLNVLESMIVHLGYRVKSSSDPEQAIVDARELGSRLAVLVTDVRMPAMNGRELYQRVVREHPKLRVLFVSGFAADVMGSEGVLEPGFELMQKPFSLEALRRKLTKLMAAQ